VALAAVVVAALASMPSRTAPVGGPTLPSQAGTDLNAHAALMAAATSAEQRVALDSGRYWHYAAKSMFQRGRISGGHDAHREEVWLAANSSDPSWLSWQESVGGGSQAHSCRLPDPPGVHVGQRLGVLDNSSVFSMDDLRSLPSDPGQLKAAILGALNREPAISPTTSSGKGKRFSDLAPADRDRLMGQAAASMLDYPVSTAVRAAAFRLLADLPGVHSLGQVTDPLGRRGVAVAVAYPGDELKVIFDPATGTHLANVMSAGYVAVTAAEWTDQAATAPATMGRCGMG
jgi:hypothetical protein